ncbi:Uncharacterised protein [Bordetella bronchiseptica]|nr:hypothetical protein DK45_1118 [Bordetella bronchiseptica]SUV58000.1 Uncharacterised protein [Bordetella bronchiseptica]
MLLGQRTEHIAQGFVQRARLAFVAQAAFVVDHPVRQFVGDDIDRDGEAVEHVAVAVAEHHLRAVPERVVVFLAIVHAGHQRPPRAIERMAAVGLPEQRIGRAQMIVGLVDRHVGMRGLPFGPHQRARQLQAAAGIVHLPVDLPGRARGRGHRRRGKPHGALAGVDAQGVDGARAQPRVGRLRQPVQQVRRHHARARGFRGRSLHRIPPARLRGARFSPRARVPFQQLYPTYSLLYSARNLQ